MKEALFYKKLKDGYIRCDLCPHFCVIPDGKAGFCGVRVNRNAVLESMVYNKVSSKAVDPIEKKPLYNFNPSTLVFSMGTLGCNMHCSHCQNWEISHVILAESFDGSKIYEVAKERSTEIITPEQSVELALKNDCDGIAWTYNEPTVWFEYTLDSAKLAKQKGLYTVYVTNGYINPEPLEMIAPYLDAFRVDVKAFNNDFYRDVAKVPDMKPILTSASLAKNKHKMHVEIVTNIIPGMNDDDAQLNGIASWISKELGPDTPWHVTRFFPYLEFSSVMPTPIETLEKARSIGLKEGLQYVYLGNVSNHEYDNTYCPKCHSVVIEREGYNIVSYEIDAENKCLNCGNAINIKWSKGSKF
ncbi:MAG: AmmeMemoRadiSam system radical SAM enzyme [Candidatus Saganbacteria bacterium]|nr:AmmeMemoRadiSam system radical SAM enzyme [Candidatus Saganbacteria bacterium]